MAKKRSYYTLDEILKHDAQINIIIGQKGNGKSYAVKKQRIIENVIRNGRKLAYIRRYGVDVKARDIESYFGDVLDIISKETKGKYCGVRFYRGYIYLAYEDENGKLVRDDTACIGRSVGLNEYAHYASQTFVGISDIVFEEFITDSRYLENEPTLLLRFLDTIARDYPDVKVWLLGNTISQVNPYFEDWVLDHIYDQKQGTIDDYFHKRYDEVLEEEIVTKISVEFCAQTGRSSRFIFGRDADHIAGGAYMTKEYGKFPGSPKDSTMVYELLFTSQGHSFVMQLWIHKQTGGPFIYIYPNKIKREIRRKIVDYFDPDPFVTVKFREDIPAEQMMVECLNMKKVCFLNNQIGQNFYNVLENRRV